MRSPWHLLITVLVSLGMWAVLYVVWDLIY